MSVPAVAAASALVLGLLVLVPPRSPGARLRRLPRGHVARVWPRFAPVPLALLLVAALAPVGMGARVAVVAAAMLVHVDARRRRRRAGVERVRDCLDEAVSVLAAELSAGRFPPAAAESAAAVAPLLFAEAAGMVRVGGDPVPVLRAGGHRVPGASGLVDVAAAWQVAQRTGAPLAPVMERVRASVAADLATAQEAAEQLAPVHATARVLAVLPLAGIPVGWALGVDTVSALTTTAWGQACLLAAVGAVGLGLAWVEIIARRAEAGAR